MPPNFQARSPKSSHESGSSMSHEEAIHSASRRTVRICEVCNRTSRQGYTISLCAGCLAISYCGSECQRSHWKIHKPICKQQAETIEETKKANRMPVVDRLFQWQTIHLATLYFAAIHGLNLSASHKNITKNAVYLRLSERSDSCSVENIAGAFSMKSIHIVDRVALSKHLVSLGSGNPSPAMDFVNSDDPRSRTEGYIGSALVVLRLGECDVLPLPLRVKGRNVPEVKVEEWESRVRLMIDQGQPYSHADEYVTKLQAKEDRRQRSRKISRKK